MKTYITVEDSALEAMLAKNAAEAAEARRKAERIARREARLDRAWRMAGLALWMVASAVLVWAARIAVTASLIAPIVGTGVQIACAVWALVCLARLVIAYAGGGDRRG